MLYVLVLYINKFVVFFGVGIVEIGIKLVLVVSKSVFIWVVFNYLIVDLIIVLFINVVKNEKKYD